MGLWKYVRDKLYKPVFIENWQRGLLLLNGKVSRTLEPGLHRVWLRPDLKIDLRIWDTRQAVVVGLEPELERALPRDWYRAVDIASGHVGLVWHYGIPTAYLPPGHYVVWTLERVPEIQMFDTASDPLPPLTAEMRRVLPTDAYLAGTVPEDHIGFLFRDGSCRQVLRSGPYGYWTGRTQLRVQLHNYRTQPFLPVAYQEILGDSVEVLDIGTHEGVLLSFEGRPSHWLAQAGRVLVWKEGRQLAVQRFDLREPAPELSRTQKEVIPASEYMEVRIGAGEVGLLTSTRETRKPQALGPGRMTVWTRGEPLQLLKLNPSSEVVLRPDLQDIVPEEWTMPVEVAHHELVVVRLGGRPVRVLGEGAWRLWVPSQVLGGNTPKTMELQLERIDSRHSAPDPRAQYWSMLPAGSVTFVNIGQGQAGILRRAGRVEGVLETGEHSFWNLEKNVVVQIVDLRPQSLQVNSQEMLTKDKVSLRLNLAVVWRTIDPVTVLERFQNPGETLYLKLQLSARRFVSSRTLDELLEGRETLETELRQHLAEQVAGTGLAIEEVGLKDLILPGTMRTILNQVVEAQRRAEANNILRREETAATRSLANTARVLANNPVLLRLKELEHVKEIADRLGQVNLIVSAKELGTLMGFPGSGASLTQLAPVPVPDAASEDSSEERNPGA